MKLLDEVKQFLDSEGVLDSSLKANTPIPVAKLSGLLYGIHCAMYGFSYEICGSIRRGKSEARDIDLLVSLRKGGSKEVDMSEVYDKLEFMGAVIITMNHSGACLVVPVDKEFIRIDVLFVEPYNFGVGLLFLTGSVEFNDFFRLHCSRKGIQFKPSGFVSDDGISCFTNERDALAFAGVAWVEPKSRTTGTQVLDLDGKLIGVVW